MTRGVAGGGLLIDTRRAVGGLPRWGINGGDESI